MRVIQKKEYKVDFFNKHRVDNYVGCVLSGKVCHPETKEVLATSGTLLTKKVLEMFLSNGVTEFNFKGEGV